MNNFQLTEEELIVLHNAFRNAKRKKDAYKINVIILLAGGWTIESISMALLISDETIRQYKQNYLKGGIKKLLKSNYCGSKCNLSKHEQRILCNELDTHIYLSTKAVIKYVKNKFNISYSVSGINDLLCRLG